MRLSATSLLTATALLSGAFAAGPGEAGAQGALILDIVPQSLTPALINRYLELKAQHLL